MRSGAVVSICLWLVIAAHGAPARPALEALPETLELPSPRIPTQIALILRNATDQPLTGVRLSWMAGGEFAVAADSALQPATVAPGGDLAWSLRVSRANDDVAPAALHFRVDYNTLAQGRSAAQILLKSVNVTTRGRDPAEKFLDVQIATSLETLESSRDALLNLVFTNKTGRPVAVDKVTPSHPDFLGIEPASPASLAIGPYGTARQGYIVKAMDRVIPGKYLLVFDIRFRSAEGGMDAERTLVASREVTVGVLGESAISKAVGLGSFLLAPGWLFLVTAGLMYRLRLLRDKNAPVEFPLEIGKPDFWLIAVAISLVFATAARLATGQWYFVRYGLEDIVWVWMISIGLGAFAYTGVQAAARSGEAARTPLAGDKPAAVLRKLSAQGLSLVLPRVSVKGKEGRPGFLIERGGGDLDAALVSPAILVRLAEIPDEALRNTVREAIRPDTPPKDLARLLAQCPPRAAAWDGEPVPEPRKLRKEDWTPADTDMLVREE